MYLDYWKKSMQAQGKHANSTKEKCNETYNKKVLDIQFSIRTEGNQERQTPKVQNKTTSKEHRKATKQSDIHKGGKRTKAGSQTKARLTFKVKQEGKKLT